MNAGTALPVIEIEQLRKCYGKQVAVDGLSLSVPAGTVMGFIGPNGAGKTTTIKMLMHMTRPSGGSARIFGLDVTKHDAELRRRVGYVPELHHIYRWMRVREVIGFCRRLYPTWNDARCAELVQLFELDPAKRVRRLSKGTLAKLGLLLAVAHEPELLILDEPTSGLDPLVREEFLDGVLQTLCQEQRTVLFSSHVMSDVQRIAERVAIIHEGRLLADQATDDLLTETKRVQVVLQNGDADIAPPAGTIWQKRQHRQWLLTVQGFRREMVEQLRTARGVERVEVADLSLEEIFKDFIKGRKAAV